MKSQQTSLFEFYDQKHLKRRYGRTEYGGQKTEGHRKLERPLAVGKWIHLVLKSDKAVGALSFLSLKNKVKTEEILRQKARKFGVRIEELVNVGNHLHLKIRIASRESFQKFLKATTCLIARAVTGAKKGKPFGRFWQGLAYTRVLKSSLEVLNLKGYFEANRREAAVSREAREVYLKQFNNWVYLERKATVSFFGGPAPLPPKNRKG